MMLVVRVFLVVALLQSHGFCMMKLLDPLARSAWGVSSRRLQYTLPESFFSTKKPGSAVKIGNPCIDGVFQYGFSDSKILQGFLNATLALKEGKAIEDIIYLPRDMASSDPLSALGYHFTVDVRYRTREGRHFLVEMQNDFRDDYHLKSLIEHARMLSHLDVDQNLTDLNSQEKGNGGSRKFWKEVQGSYTLVITNKAFPLSRKKKYYTEEPLMEPELVNPYELRHIQQLGRHYGDIPNQIILLMLSNLSKKPSELSSSVERCSYLLKDSSMKSGVKKIAEEKEIEDPEVVAGGDPAIQSFIDRLNMKNLPEDIRNRYIRAVHYYNTTVFDIEEKAEERGVEKGVQQGIEQKTKKVVDNLIQRYPHMSDEDIAGIAELSPDQVKALRILRKKDSAL